MKQLFFRLAGLYTRTSADERPQAITAALETAGTDLAVFLSALVDHLSSVSIDELTSEEQQQLQTLVALAEDLQDMRDVELTAAAEKQSLSDTIRQLAARSAANNTSTAVEGEVLTADHGPLLEEAPPANTPAETAPVVEAPAVEMKPESAESTDSASGEPDVSVDDSTSEASSDAADSTDSTPIAQMDTSDEDTSKTPDDVDTPDASNVNEESDGETVTDKQKTGELVAAVDVAALPSDNIAPRERVAITAAGDMPGYSAGQPISDGKALAASIAQRLSSGTGSSPITLATLRNTQQENRLQSYGGKATLDLDLTRSYEIASEGGALTAAVCGPADIFRELCTVDPPDGLVDIPEFVTSALSLNVTSGVDFDAIYTSIGDGTPPKTCYEATCVPNEDFDLSPIPACLRIPLILRAAAPNQLEYLQQLLLRALAARINAERIAAMVAASLTTSFEDGGAVPVSPKFGTATDGLSWISSVAEWIRYRDRLSPRRIMNVVLPLWAKRAMQEDLWRRNAYGTNEITEQHLNDRFAQFNLRPQWVYDWQDAYPTGVDTDFGGPVPPGNAAQIYPDTVDALIFPEGAFLGLSQDVITLRGVHDSASLQQNLETALFAEVYTGVAKRCYNSVVATIPVCSSGGSGAQQERACVPAPAP